MSQQAMARVIERASTDAAFRSQLKSNPENALAGYDLTGDERAAVLRGDSGTMNALGIDARVSKIDPGWQGDGTPLSTE